MSNLQVNVPDIGDFTDVTVIEILVKVGDTIKPEQSLVTVESDKASMEIPASHAGVVKKVLVKMGDKINQGTPLLELEVGAEAAPAPAAPPAAQTAAQVSAAAAPTEAAPASTTQAAPAPVAVPAAASQQVAPREQKLLVPDIGDFRDVAVIEILVKVGDTIKPEQSLVTVESDKASMEIPASHGGVLQSLSIKIGDKLNIADVLGVVRVTDAQSINASAAPAAPAKAEQPAVAAAAPQAPATAPVAARSDAAAPVASESSAPSSALPHASPSVRKFARELGVALERVAGSGEKGRITQEDVQAYTRGILQSATQTVAAQAASTVHFAQNDLNVLPWPKVDFSKFGTVERKALSRIQKISGANLHRNWVRIPHVTNHDDADITDLEQLRVQLNSENAKAGVKVTMLAFIIKACVAALKKFPQFNASLDGEELVLKQYYHIAFAADTPNGLVVPVVKNADRKGIMELSQELGELAAKARDGKLSAADMQGACFTISSLGGIGGTYFTPIINAPEVAILGVCRSSMQPVWDGKAFAPRLMLPLSLSYDHRVIDGAAAARFNVYLRELLQDFRRVIL